MLQFTGWDGDRRVAEYAERRYEVIDQVKTKNSIALLITLTRQAGDDEATTQLTEFPTNQTDRRAAEVMALETAFQYAHLGDDYDEEEHGLPRLSHAINQAYAIHRQGVNKR